MTVTELRKDIFNVFEATKVNEQVTEVMLHGEVIAEIVPKKAEKIDWDEYEKKLNEGIKKLKSIDWEKNHNNFRKNFKFTKW